VILDNKTGKKSKITVNWLHENDNSKYDTV